MGAVIRMPEAVWAAVHRHLFATPGEHFAFLLAGWASIGGAPLFLVRDALLVPDEQVAIGREGGVVTTEAILASVNAAVRTGSALIEIHNHGGQMPRFSPTDRAGFREFPAYVLDSLPGRPYAATVWGDATVYSEYFLPGGRTGVVASITAVGQRLRQLVSRNDELPVAATFDRQLPWFTADGQRQLGRLRIAIVGAGGTGSQVAQNLAYSGVRDAVVIDDDVADETNGNRLVTATAADLGTPKGILSRRLIKSVSPGAAVEIIAAKVQSARALDALKGVDAIFGCVDNDGARLILNELALAYSIPYLDLGVGIEVEDGRVVAAGGRVAVVLPGGPCLACMGEIDPVEARFHLSSPVERTAHIARGYVTGLDAPAPAVVSLNAAVAATAVSEFAVLISGLRPVAAYTELDLLGVGRPVKGQWMTPRRVAADPGCVSCGMAGVGDAISLGRYIAEASGDGGKAPSSGADQGIAPDRQRVRSDVPYR